MMIKKSCNQNEPIGFFELYVINFWATKLILLLQIFKYAYDYYCKEIKQRNNIVVPLIIFHPSLAVDYTQKTNSFSYLIS